jgi:tRNA (adenine37-N6)-methyltransferase
LENSKPMVLRPIGQVHSPVRGDKWSDWEEVVAEIEIESELEEALTGIEGFSHLIVLFWLDRAETPINALIHPRDRQDLPLTGYLATRTPNRPNPIALTVVRLLNRRGRVLKVRGLDAFDGSLVIDVKPYMPLAGGEEEEVQVPDWLQQPQS